MIETQRYHPWRRFWARMLDLSIYETLWIVLLALGFGVNLSTRGSFSGLLDIVVSMAIMLLAEPLLLHFLGTTPGKAIFGLQLRAADGSKLTLAQARTRTGSVLGAGMGYSIPIYNLVRLWKSYTRCTENQPQPWDEGLAYTVQDTKWYRWVLFAAAHGLIFFAVYLTISFQALPPNRGELTVAEFAKNYNYYADYYGMSDTSSYLDATGSWVEKPVDGTVYLSPFTTDLPALYYTEQNGLLTGVSFAVTFNNKEDAIPSYYTQMLLSALAFAGAQPEVGLFSDLPQFISDWLAIGELGNHSLVRAGIAFAVDTEHRGYDVMRHFLLPQEGAEELFFSLHFSMTKQ